MSQNYPVLGEGYVPAYQMSATPFLTASNLALGQIVEIRFKAVSRFFTIRSLGDTSTVISVAFTENGLRPENANYIVLSGSQTFTAEIKTDRLFISGTRGASTFNLIAGLTCIPDRNFTTITSSNGYLSVG